MLGAIAGDMIGSRFEWNNYKGKDFELFNEASCFTDDTVLTVAQADSLLNKVPFAHKLKEYYRSYPDAGYGGSFHQWALSGSEAPYGSWGNGSAMRVSPVGWFFEDLETVLAEARNSAAVTHNHPEGIRGAQAVAAAIFLARKGDSKTAIRRFIHSRLGYRLDFTLEQIRPDYRFDVSCQGSVPQALQAFFESVDFIDALRSAVSIGGDSDTIACITGGVAEAFYGGVPAAVAEEVWPRLDSLLTRVTRRFRERVEAQ